jgi:hypothetical protein
VAVAVAVARVAGHGSEASDVLCINARMQKQRVLGQYWPVILHGGSHVEARIIRGGMIALLCPLSFFRNSIPSADLRHTSHRCLFLASEEYRSHSEPVDKSDDVPPADWSGGMGPARQNLLRQLQEPPDGG